VESKKVACLHLEMNSAEVVQLILERGTAIDVQNTEKFNELTQKID